MVTPPVFYNENSAVEKQFLGKSPAELRALLRSAIDTPITLSFRSAALETVAREISQKTGLGIGITPDVAVAGEGRPIDLDARNLRTRHALDWLTRLLDAHYAVEGPETVFITRDRTWASQDRLKFRSYPVGALVRVDRARVSPYDSSDDQRQLLAVLSGCLRHTMTGHRDAQLLIDDTGSRLSAMLPPRGHEKLARILVELKKPRRYEPPAPETPDEKERSALLQTPVLCNFVRQDVRHILDGLGRRAKVNIGFDYRRIPKDRRDVAVALGETTLGRALEAVTKAAGMGDLLVESERRVWILADGQDRGAVLRNTGELPWDRAVVRSYYLKPFIDNFGFRLFEEQIRKTVTPGQWGDDLPVGYYHAPSGRLVVLHNEEAQRELARRLERTMKMLGPRRRPPR